jgi:hypothetical protein
LALCPSIQTFGAPQNRKFDLGTAVAAAIQQGAQNFRCVRVSDGTDAAATSTGVATCITFTALYTGSLGNNLTVQIATGSKAASFKAIISVPGGQPEVFDNITGSGNAFWVNLANAINKGNNALRGPSRLVTAAAGGGTTAASATTCTFTGGVDGSGVTSTQMLGSDTTPRAGMYALRNSGASILVMSDLDDSTKWSTVDGFALNEGMYAIQTGPSGDTISNAVTTKQTAGLDSYSSKLMFGDWILWNDLFNSGPALHQPTGLRCWSSGKPVTRAVVAEQDAVRRGWFSAVQQHGGNIQQRRTADFDPGWHRRHHQPGRRRTVHLDMSRWTQFGIEPGGQWRSLHAADEFHCCKS